MRRAYFHILLKVSDEPVRADVQRFCIVLHADFGVVVLVEVGNGGFDLLRNVYLHTFAFLLLAADKKQNRVEHRGNVVLIAILALLQLPDDFSEQHLILRQSSAVKDVLIQWDAMISQNVLHVIASEMNPEYFRMVFYIINVFLNLFRLVKNHMTGCDNFLLAVEPEVSFSGGHIQNPVVTPSFLPESRQGRASFQPIGAAAANTLVWSR